MLKIKKIASGWLGQNCYLVYDSQTLKAAIIDPGQDGEKVISEITALNLKPEILLNTHGHYDHSLADDEIRLKYKIPLAAHKDEAALLQDPYINASAFILNSPQSIKVPDILFIDGQTLKLSFCEISVIHTPGHTSGGVCFLIGDNLFTGDTLFAGSIGRTDFPASSHEDMLNSLEKLKKLPPELKVYPGHGPATSISNELRHNPYLNAGNR